MQVVESSMQGLSGVVWALFVANIFTRLGGRMLRISWIRVSIGVRFSVGCMVDCTCGAGGCLLVVFEDTVRIM